MSNSRRIVLASHNAGKLQELQTLLAPLALELLLLPDSTAVAPQETGSTFIENALIKARAATQLTGMPAIADDSGLCVDALAGAPGVHSARFAGAMPPTRTTISCCWSACVGLHRRSAERYFSVFLCTCGA